MNNVYSVIFHHFCFKLSGPSLASSRYCAWLIELSHTQCSHQSHLSHCMACCRGRTTLSHIIQYMLYIVWFCSGNFVTCKIYSCPHFHSVYSWAMRQLEAANGLAHILSDCYSCTSQQREAMFILDTSYVRSFVS